MKKDIKDFIKELCDCAKPSPNGSVVTLEEASRIISEAYIAGINFQASQTKANKK